MKYLAAGLAVLAIAGLNIAFLTLGPTAPITPQSAAMLNVLLALIGTLVLFSGGGQVRREAQALRDQDAFKARATEMGSRLESAEAARDAVTAELEAERERTETQRREWLAKTVDLEEKLRAARSKAEARPEAIDAELVGLLSLLQRRGRFVDFLMDDIARYDDAQVGAAARVVHQGCNEVIREFFDIEPIRTDPEGDLVTVAGDYEPERYQLVGKVAGKPPFRGTLLHRGWKTTRVTLPRIAATGQRDVIAPAEVELN